MENFDDIAVFVRVVEAGGFTAAADKLGLSQSAVSKCVNRLEARLGTRLLNRSTRRLSLTEAGTALHAHGVRALNELAQAELEVAQLQAEPRGVLRVNAPMSFGVLHIAPAIDTFLRCYPALTLDLQLDDRLVDVVEEGFDCAVRIKSLTDSTLVAKKLAPCRQAVCATPAYLAQHGSPRTPDELRAHRCLVYTYRAKPLEWEFTAPNGENIRIAISGALHSNSGLANREVALRDGGLLIVPTFYIGDDLRSGRLQAVLEDYTPLPEANIYAVYPERRNLSPKVRAFIDFLAARFGPEPYWDER